MTEVAGSLTVHDDGAFSDLFHEGPAALQHVGGAMDLQVGRGWLQGYRGLKTVGGMLSVSVIRYNMDAFARLISTGGLSLFGRAAAIAGKLRHDRVRVGRVSAATPALFRALEHVGGALSTRNLDDGINALTRSAGTLSILNVPRNLGPGSIRGYRKLSTVAGDLLIAKELTTHRPASGQHLLDQLVGFTGRVILL